MDRKHKTKMLVGKSETSNMNRTASGIAGVFEEIKTKISILDREIKADEKGKKDYEDELNKLERKRRELRNRLQENKLWESNFDKDIEPLEKLYSQMTLDINVLYGDAKLKHAQGVQVLINEFLYHPQYKRWCDEFTAVPFKPK